MKVQNTPAALGFLAGLLVLLFGLIANAGCRFPMERDASVALEQTVQIAATCISETNGSIAQYYGTGVIVDAQTIITAAHVAEDPSGYVCVRSATMMNEHSYLVMPGKILHDRDLATLVLDVGEFDPTYPVIYGAAPKFGDRLCSMVAFPMWLWRCGEAQQTVSPPGDRIHTIIVEPGNSGSGVYNVRGQLVGIITHRWSCVTGQICGGKMSTLEGFVHELTGS